MAGVFRRVGIERDHHAARIPLKSGAVLGFANDGGGLLAAGLTIKRQRLERELAIMSIDCIVVIALRGCLADSTAQTVIVDLAPGVAGCDFRHLQFEIRKELTRPGRRGDRGGQFF